MMALASPSNASRRRWTKRRRTNYAGCVAFLAACLGFSAVLVSILVSADPRLNPAHLGFSPSIIIGGAGAVAAIAIAAPVTYLLGERGPPRSPWVCLGLGLAFGLALPLVTGGLLPSSLVVMDWNLGLTSAGQLPSELLSAQFRAPLNSFVYASLNIVTGLIFGVVFGLGFWVINALTAAANLAVSHYGPWIFVFAFGPAAVLMAAYGPPDILMRFG